MVKMYSIEDLEKMKSEPLLSDFWKYCLDHPELRFWQALRNWSGNSFILTSHFAPTDEQFGSGGDIKDTFYWEEKNK